MAFGGWLGGIRDAKRAMGGQGRDGRSERSGPLPRHRRERDWRLPANRPPPSELLRPHSSIRTHGLSGRVHRWVRGLGAAISRADSWSRGVWRSHPNAGLSARPWRWSRPGPLAPSCLRSLLRSHSASGCDGLCFTAPQWFVRFSAQPEPVQEHDQLAGHRDHRFALLDAAPFPGQCQPPAP